MFAIFHHCLNKYLWFQTGWWVCLQVNRFLHQQQGKGAAANNKYVLVHCTHGHNRTGFMIVHYLMRTQCSSVAQVYCYSLTAYFVVWLGFLACLLCCAFKTHEATAAEGHLTGWAIGAQIVRIHLKKSAVSGIYCCGSGWDRHYGCLQKQGLQAYISRITLTNSSPFTMNENRSHLYVLLHLNGRGLQLLIWMRLPLLTKMTTMKTTEVFWLHCRWGEMNSGS